METCSRVSGGSEPLKKAIRAAVWRSGHQKISNFSACKAQGNQHEIRNAFFERDMTAMLVRNFLKHSKRYQDLV